MRWFGLVVALVFPLSGWSEETSPEVQLALTSLRPGERARVERALGRADSLPLYKADLEFDPATRVVKGRVVVTVTPKTKLTELKLRVVPNAAHPGAVNLTSAEVGGKAAVLEQPQPSLFRVKLPEPIAAGTPVSIELSLTAVVPKAEAGSDKLSLNPETVNAHGGDYGAFSAAPEVSCLAGLLPMVPPIINGRLEDGPSGVGDLGTFDPSNFIVSVKVPAGYVVVAPGNRMGELPDGKGSVRYANAVAAAREFPILVAKDVELATAKAGDVTVESWFAPADKASGKAVLEHATKALVDLEKRLGPYPYQKFRIVEARLVSGAGGMEFPGLITVSTALYRGTADPLSVLGMSDATSAPMLQGMFLSLLQPLMANTLEFTVDHEVTHQYFAMLVGSDPIEEPIVDEPLTQHGALLLFEARHGREAADALRDGQLKMAYQFHRLNGGVDGKANRSTREYASNGEYAALVYGKAPLLFDALREEVGEEAWAKALRTYVDDSRYKWTSAKTLSALLVKQNPTHAARIEELRRRWWEERHGDEDVGSLDLEKVMQAVTGASGTKGGAPMGIDPKVIEAWQKAMEALGE